MYISIILYVYKYLLYKVNYVFKKKIRYIAIIKKKDAINDNDIIYAYSNISTKNIQKINNCRFGY